MIYYVICDKKKRAQICEEGTIWVGETGWGGCWVLGVGVNVKKTVHRHVESSQLSEYIRMTISK